MDYYLVDKFNRGLDTKSEAQAGGGVTEQELNNKILQLQKEFSLGVRDLLGRIKNELLTESSTNIAALKSELEAAKNRIKAIEDIGKLYSVTDTYFSAKNRRMVSIARGKDKNDAVIMSQFTPVRDHVNKLLAVIAVSDSTVEIKGNRTISNVTKGTNKYDVAINEQITNLEEKLLEARNEIRELNAKFSERKKQNE